MSKIITWRQSIIKSQALKSNTKHVLVNLSFYINDVGNANFPSVQTLSEDTSLPTSGVISALNMAEAYGYLQKTNGGAYQSEWIEGKYVPMIPNGKLYGFIDKSTYNYVDDCVLARKRVASAIRTGKLKSQNCEICGDKKTEAHHTDYSKPLSVIWLCRKHHNRITKVEKAMADMSAESAGVK